MKRIGLPAVVVATLISASAMLKGEVKQ